MAQINNINDLVMDSKNLPLNTKDLNLFTKSISYKLPQDFIKSLEIADGYNTNYVFEYFDEYLESKYISGFSTIFGIKTDNTPFYNIINENNSPPEFFPNTLVAFAEDGGGNRICFDYRKNPNTDNPPIVYWNHEATVGEDVSFIANNFNEFIKILEKSDECEELSEEEFEEWYNNLP